MNLSRIILLVIVLISSNLSSQTKQDLEKQKKQIQNDIKKIELKLSNSSKQKKLIVSNAEDINYKIQLQQKLINNINSQLNLILSEIDRNENKLSNLKELLKYIILSGLTSITIPPICLSRFFEFSK